MSGGIVQCMGGWCKRRDGCAHYVARPLRGMNPAERLCPPGVDDPEAIKARRFDAWLAGATAEQAAAWNNRKSECDE